MLIAVCDDIKVQLPPLVAPGSRVRIGYWSGNPPCWEGWPVIMAEWGRGPEPFHGKVYDVLEPLLSATKARYMEYLQMRV